ncbi:MAG: hypothetical protein H0Z34_03370 [Brevibacillus sp.]|nr:hypothetical protein [Brevibacillus sp.]
MIGIEAMGCYVPHHRLHLKELQHELRIDNRTLHRLLWERKLEYIAIEQDHTAAGMLAKAADNLLAGKKLTADDVGLILLTHTLNPFAPYLVDPLGKWRQQNGFADTLTFAAAQLNCASIHLLLHLADRWLRAHSQRTGVLLLAGDKMFIAEERCLDDSFVAGDAAVAVYLSRHAKRNRLIHSFIVGEATIYDGPASPPAAYAWYQQSFVYGLIKMVQTALNECRLSPQQIRYIFPSNLNETTWLRVAHALDLPHDRFYYPTLKELGHCHNADPILNLARALVERLLQPGDYYLTLTAGMGGTFGCSLFQY